MGWWKTLQDALHPPPPKKKKNSVRYSGGSEHFLPSHHTDNSPSRAPKKARRRTISSVARYRAVIALRSRILWRLLFVVGCLVLIPLIVTTNVNTHSHNSDRLKQLNGIARKHHPGSEDSYGRFPCLEKYYGGLAKLVRWEKNTPEFDGLKASMGTMREVGAPEFGVVEKEGWVEFPRKSEEDVSKEGKVKCTLEDGSMPAVYAWKGVPLGMPAPLFGSHEVLGIDGKVCFDRRGRYGDYGLGRNGTGGVGSVEGEEDDEAYQNRAKFIDYTKVNWKKLQDQCWEKNLHRFSRKKNGGDKTPPRTAIVLRTWSDYNYKASDILNLRALAAELSLYSSGNYQLRILMHVRDSSIPIYASPSVAADVVAKSSLPKEFHGLVTVWHEDMMRILYSSIQSDYMPNPPDDYHFRRLPIHGVYRSTFMPVQIFAQQHPEYDYFWHWEMDIRYTGHYYHLFESLHQFSRRSAGHDWVNRHFYIPFLHGSYENFLSLYSPKTAEEKKNSPDRSGEDADLITLNPIFDPLNSSWILNIDSNFPEELPHRTAIVTASRLSRRLLDRMHTHAVEGRTAFSEMLAPTVAFQEGMKIVVAPHPVWIDRNWPKEAVRQVFGGVDGEVWGDVEERWRGVTWFYNSNWAEKVFRRWLGTEEKEKERGLGGRMCLPGGWLIHPVK